MSRTTVAVLVVVVVLAAGGGIVYAATRKPERDDALAAAQAAALARASGQAPEPDGSVIERLTGGRVSGAAAGKAQSFAADLLAEGGRRLTRRASEPEAVVTGGTEPVPPAAPVDAGHGFGAAYALSRLAQAGAFAPPPPPTSAVPPPMAEVPYAKAVPQVRQTVGRSRAPVLRRSLTRGAGSF